VKAFAAQFANFSSNTWPNSKLKISPIRASSREGIPGCDPVERNPHAAPNAVFFIRREESDILKVLQPISHSSRIAERICPACVGGGTDIVDQCLNQVAAFANRGMVFALNEKLLGVGQVLENDSFVLQPTLPD